MIFDIVIIGGGHAGVEAAYAASTMGSMVCLVTMHLDLLGQMSCNPAIGGIAKGIMVREIDALGGLMGRLADKTGIQFKMLNQTKGPAVWGPRAQIDKAKYRHAVKGALENTERLSLLQDIVVEIVFEGSRVVGIKTISGISIRTSKIIITTGTFLNGLAHVGLDSFDCGRTGEPSSWFVTECLNRAGIVSGRLKTGTSARISKKTVNLSVLETQKGDETPWPFSYLGKEELKNTVDCYMTRTKPSTHAVIKENLGRSPLYSGKITGVGPRYCPSIEDKIVRFGERDGHTLFLEPEGLDTDEMYLNGFSTSLPVDAQIQMLRTLYGFEEAQILRPAYAIEYDYFPPTQLYQTLESRIIKGLYFAGQVNGTSGYEEAASQGLVAGINAALSVVGRPPFIMRRDESYIGVLIDDLVTKGTEEPYRMFTSRAEYRILLRQDNADVRLMAKGKELGLIAEDDFSVAQERWKETQSIRKRLFETKLSPEKAAEISIKIEEKSSLGELLLRPEIDLSVLSSVLPFPMPCRPVAETVQADIKYSGFAERLEREIIAVTKMDQFAIPLNTDYGRISGLLMESRQKLSAIKPLTIGQASRISGVTPADITVLIVYLQTEKQ